MARGTIADSGDLGPGCARRVVVTEIDIISNPDFTRLTCEDGRASLNRPEIGQIGEFCARLVHFSALVGSTCTGPVVVHAGYEPTPGPGGGITW